MSQSVPTAAGPRRLLVGAVVTVLLALSAPAASAAVPATFPTTPALTRAGLVDVRSYAPGIRTDVRYATANNFTGAVLPGYCEPWAMLRGSAAQALGRIHRRLAADGLGLLVYDGYRPARATRGMVRWAERTGNTWVLRNGYVSSRSHHAFGGTVDLTLVRLSSGRRLNMGTPYDTFSRRSSTASANGSVLANRLRLVRAMRTEGFVNYRREWWHYERQVTNPRRLDVSLGC